ncbi:MAG: hypothetical protein ACOY3Y_03410 [Acidobacteriota bacterium]
MSKFGKFFAALSGTLTFLAYAPRAGALSIESVGFCTAVSGSTCTNWESYSPSGPCPNALGYWHCVREAPSEYCNGTDIEDCVVWTIMDSDGLPQNIRQIRVVVRNDDWADVED